MKYTWVKQTESCQELADKLGARISGITRGHLVVGYEEGLDTDNKPIQIPITKEGIEIEIENATPEILQRLDLMMGELKRENGKTLPETVLELVNQSKT